MNAPDGALVPYRHWTSAQTGPPLDGCLHDSRCRNASISGFNFRLSAPYCIVDAVAFISSAWAIKYALVIASLSRLNFSVAFPVLLDSSDVQIYNMCAFGRKCPGAGCSWMPCVKKETGEIVNLKFPEWG